MADGGMFTGGKSMGFKNLIKKANTSRAGLAKLTKERRHQKRQKYATE